MSSFAFTKALRLLSPSDFKPVFDQADFRASHQHFVILARPNELGHPRIGLIIAKKNVRQANARNRIKRLVRELFRLQQYQLPALDCIFLARRGLDQLDNETFSKQLLQQFNKLSRKATAPQTSQK